ncbi:MAG: aminopeptidase [Oscillospiraceae bacterium]|nr:aminopeptidase [Oscillospiraceae bacterium]
MSKREEYIRAYAKLVVRAGINIQPGQELMVNALVEAAPFIREVVREAYAAGSGKVHVNWRDETVSRLDYDNLPVSFYESVPDWQQSLLNGLAERGAGFLHIDSSDPTAFVGVDPMKFVAMGKAMKRDCKAYREGLDKGRNAWCIAAIPSPKWAARVFPDVPVEEAVDKLWDAILTATRADMPDPVAAWDEHRRSFDEKKAWLNEMSFDALRFRSVSTGTDITIGMNPGHRWAGGGDETVGGTYFFPNMPTEEIFCTPDLNRADGVVCSSMPLCHHGTMIDNFSLTFRDGKVVAFSAGEGYETLKSIIETDEGALHLGECALIPKGSPIDRTGILFYNTLFDENAACHFAIGAGFPECIENGLELSKEELKARGVNDSATHVDFMFGTADMEITGIAKDGTETPIFANGVWTR